MKDKLEAGDKAPEFSLENQNSQIISLNDYLGKKVLVYFYPKANTPGCTTQSCEVRDAKPNFNELNVEVIGISPDLPKKQATFDEKFSLGFNLLSDPEHKVADSFGVWGEKKLYGKAYMGLIRSAFLINEEGRIIESFYKVSPKDTVPKALKALKK